MISFVCSRCKSLAQACQVNTSACVLADDYCNEFETTPYYKSGLNPYDIRKECGSNSLCYDFSNIETFLNLKVTFISEVFSSSNLKSVVVTIRIFLHK